MEETSEEPKEKRRPFRSELIVALAAITISVATLFVYIYQARIMQEQQHVSVWPYLEWTFTMSSSEGFFISLENKGVGPAIIKSAKLTLDGEQTEARAFVEKIVGTIDSLSLFTESVEGRVLAPGDKVQPFHVGVRDLREYRALQKKFDGVYVKLAYVVCYCSIYGDCWTSKGLEVVEDACD